MTPRLPEDTPDDDVQTRILQAIHEAMKDPVEQDDQLLVPAQQDTSVQHVTSGDMLDTTVEIDRAEAYLRGPTVFTA